MTISDGFVCIFTKTVTMSLAYFKATIANKTLISFAVISTGINISSFPS